MLPVGVCTPGSGAASAAVAEINMTRLPINPRTYVDYRPATNLIVKRSGVIPNAGAAEPGVS
jgi:hypothetical protein